MPLGKIIGNDVGARGLVVYRPDDTYWYKTEADWRTTAQVDGGIPASVAKLRETRSLSAWVDQSVYLDLDQMADLEDPSKDRPGGAVKFDPSKVSVIFREGDKLYQIPLSEDNLTQLPPGFEGAARVVVSRGGILAAIPKNDIPSGTYCVLVNLAGLKPPPAK